MADTRSLWDDGLRVQGSQTLYAEGSAFAALAESGGKNAYAWASEHRGQKYHLLSVAPCKEDAPEGGTYEVAVARCGNQMNSGGAHLHYLASEDDPQAATFCAQCAFTLLTLQK